jgi:FtsP/CotA-like multicopper oxidase with cupredoxin domain
MRIKSTRRGLLCDADSAAPLTDLSFEEALRARNPLAQRSADRSVRVVLGEGPNYEWTINGLVHGRERAIEARAGERLEIQFMNPTSMMHPMHVHGNHFQVVGTRAGRYQGPVRDTVIVPPHSPAAVHDALDKRGRWYLHCHHLYHIAAGMMAELRVT